MRFASPSNCPAMDRPPGGRRWAGHAPYGAAHQGHLPCWGSGGPPAFGDRRLPAAVDNGDGATASGVLPAVAAAAVMGAGSFDADGSCYPPLVTGTSALGCAISGLWRACMHRLLPALQRAGGAGGTRLTGRGAAPACRPTRYARRQSQRGTSRLRHRWVHPNTKRLLYLHDTTADSKLGCSVSGRARRLQPARAHSGGRERGSPSSDP
jgi:hypothetical protein